MKFRYLLLLLAVPALFAIAHEDEPLQEGLPGNEMEHESGESLSHNLAETYPPLFVLGISFIVAVMLLFYYHLSEKTINENLKKAVFVAVCLIFSVSTVYIAGLTILTNLESDAKGPVHLPAYF